MKLTDLNIKDNLALKISINGKTLDFKSIIQFKIKDYILIEPIRFKGKLVNFESKSVSIDIMFSKEQNVPIIWKRVLLKIVRYKGKNYYKVIPSAEGFSMNRRGAYRVYIGLQGVVQIGANTMGYQVIVKDISDTGFAFVMSEDIDASLRSTIRLVFIDDNITYNLLGLLVRKERINDKKYVYGCILNTRNNELNKYINNKQRLTLSKQNKSSVRNSDVIKKLQNMEKEKSIIQEKQQIYAAAPDYRKQALNDVDKNNRRDIFIK